MDDYQITSPCNDQRKILMESSNLDHPYGGGTEGVFTPKKLKWIGKNKSILLLLQKNKKDTCDFT